MASYAQWEILLTWLPSSDNTPPNYPHPCIYLGDSTRKPEHIIVLGITSDLSQRDPIWSCDMPWAASKHPQTGLDRPSIARPIGYIMFSGMNNITSSRLRACIWDGSNQLGLVIALACKTHVEAFRSKSDQKGVT